MIHSIGLTQPTDATASAGAERHGRHFRSGKTTSQDVSVQATHVESESRQEGALKITTADGDTVSISFAALQQFKSDSYGATAGGSSARSAKSTTKSAVKLDVKVNGSLDKNEIADISKLVDQLTAAVNDAHNGDSAKAAQDLSSIGSLDSVRSFRFAYQESTQLKSNTTRSSTA
jgi:hypothetical protein